MKNKNNSEANSNQIIPKEWLGPTPLIVNGTLRVQINEVVYLPKLIQSIPVKGDVVLIVFKMGKDIFKSVGYDCIVKG
jgi:hypothetical protein